MRGGTPEKYRGPSCAASSGEETGEGEGSQKRERLFEYLSDIFDAPHLPERFEERLDAEGLLAGLEKLWILPGGHSANKGDRLGDEKELGRRGASTPETKRDIYEELTERQQILRYLFTGAVLGHMFGKIISQGEDKAEGGDLMSLPSPKKLGVSISRREMRWFGEYGEARLPDSRD